MKKLLILSFVLSAYSFGFGQSAVDFYEAGKDKHLQQDYRGAISDYTKAIGLDNNFTAAYESRASCRGLLADTNGAIADVSMAIKVEKSDSAKSELYRHRAFWKKSSGDYLGAIDDYGQAIKHFPRGDGHFFRGIAKQEYGDNKGAILDLEEAKKNAPKLFSLYHYLGAAKLALGDNKGAELDFTVSLEYNFIVLNGNFTQIRYSDYYAAESFRLRALAKTRLGILDGALSDYDKAIELDARNWGAFFSRGLLKSVFLKDRYGALSDLSNSIKINEENPESYYWRGAIKCGLLDFNGALLDFSSAIRLDSDNSDYYFKRGEVKRFLEDFRGAIADYNSSINLDASAPPSYYGRAVAKYLLSDFRGAIADINMALAFDREFADEGLAYFVRGACKVSIGQKESGCLDLSKAGEMGVGDAYDLIREHCN